MEYFAPRSAAHHQLIAHHPDPALGWVEAPPPGTWEGPPGSFPHVGSNMNHLYGVGDSVLVYTAPRPVYSGPQYMPDQSGPRLMPVPAHQEMPGHVDSILAPPTVDPCPRADIIKNAPLRTKVLAVLLPTIIAVVCNVIYMAFSNFAQKKYLEFVEQHPEAWADDARLPDLILDALANVHESRTVLLTWTTISDAVPLVLLGICSVYLVVRQHFTLINRILLTQSFLILLNCLAENLTVLPSSYGYHRCLDYLQIKSSKDLPDVV